MIGAGSERAGVSRARRALKAAATLAAGNPVAERAAVTATAGRLRILAYHRITRPDRFRFQMEHLTRHYYPVDAATAAPALTAGGALPRKAVWVTFDDGDPSVVADGQPILDEFGVRATMFVCPAVIGTTTPLWWDTVAQALAAGAHVEVSGRRWSDGSVVSHLKTVDDATRRAAVARAGAAVEARTGQPPSARQLAAGELRQWLGAGHTIGNHTWDHPLLDRCDPDARRAQVTDAHDWLAARLGEQRPRLFAYPNGNWAAETEVALARLGYEVGLLFDQRLARRGGPPLRVSRLRVSADAEPATFRAKLSGAWALTGMLRGR